MLLTVSVLIHARLSGLARSLVRRAARDEAGQATAEYALVLLGAAAVAVMLIAWASKTGKIRELMDDVLDKVLHSASSK